MTQLQFDHEFVERLKLRPNNVADQLRALTAVSDDARAMHRENFDCYLIAGAELIEAAIGLPA